MVLVNLVGVGQHERSIKRGQVTSHPAAFPLPSIHQTLNQDNLPMSMPDIDGFVLAIHLALAKVISDSPQPVKLREEIGPLMSSLTNALPIGGNWMKIRVAQIPTAIFELVNRICHFADKSMDGKPLLSGKIVSCLAYHPSGRFLGIISLCLGALNQCLDRYDLHRKDEISQGDLSVMAPFPIVPIDGIMAPI